MSQRHGIGDAVLFLNHFASSLYDQFLTRRFHLNLENIGIEKLKSKFYTSIFFIFYEY